MSIFKMITFGQLSSPWLFEQVALFAAVIFIVSNKKVELMIRRTASHYCQLLPIFLLSVLAGVIIFLCNRVLYCPWYDDIYDFFDCAEGKIFFILAYLITFVFLYNFVKIKSKFILIFFTPILFLVQEINYFLVALIFTLIAWYIGSLLSKFNKVNYKNQKSKELKKYNIFAVFIVFWLYIYTIPLILMALSNDGGWIFLYLLYAPVSLSFIPYALIHSDNQKRNVLSLIFGLIVPCMLNNILICYLIGLAFSHMTLF